MIYIGIDPGKSGAVAAINGTEVKLYDTPVARIKDSKNDYIPSAMAKIIKDLEATRPCFIVLEKVHAMPGQGVSSMFSFGEGLGLWKGIIAAYGIPYELVAPQTWKKAMMADMPRDNKDASRIVATRLFPNAVDMLSRKKDDGRAEALLMAEYGKRLQKDRI